MTSPEITGFETQKPKVQRITYLDSMRGIAALTVMIGHCFMVVRGIFPQNREDYANAFTSVSNMFVFIMDLIAYEGTRAAVMLFFVLSGFVLTFSLKGRRISYANYAIRRIARIYPLFLFVILCSFILHRFIVIQNVPAVEGIKALLSVSTSVTVLIKHLLMYGNVANDTLDPPMWTIIHEIRISLLFPILLISLIRFRWASILAYTILSLLCAWAIFRISGTTASEDTVVQTFIISGFYIVYFACGAFLAIESEYVAHQVERLASWQKIGLLVFCFYCLLL